MKKDANRFFVAQAVPEIYEKKEMLKNRGDVFFLLFTVCNNELTFDGLQFTLNKIFLKETLETFVAH